MSGNDDNLEQDPLYRDNPNQNPCTFKGICKTCRKVQTDDRPVVCKQIECPDYRPCPQCHNNRDLDPVQHICENCIKANNRKKTPTMSADDKAVARGRKKFPGLVGEEVQGAINKLANGGSLTSNSSSEPPPEFDELGVAPKELNAREKAYFQQRWEEYEGFYRDPSAYYIIHQMILAEIASRRTETQILDSTYELKTGKIEEKKAWLDYIALLKKQLPEREAQRENDAETALNHIYQKYLEEKHVRVNGTVSRIFSPEAIALEPRLLFKPELRRILIKLGYQVPDIETALNHLPDLGKTPSDALKALGFDLDEKYAMPYEPDEDYGDPGPGDQVEFGAAEVGVEESDE